MRLASLGLFLSAALAMPSSALIIDFDEFPTGTTFDDSVRFDEGEPFTSAGVRFETTDTGIAGPARTFIGQVGFANSRSIPSAGNYLYPRSVTMDLAASLGTRPFVSIPFYNSGGTVTLGANGSDVLVARGGGTAVFELFDGADLSGVAVDIVRVSNSQGRIELRGDIDTVLFGGQEAIFDNVFVADPDLELIEVVTLPGQGESVSTQATLASGLPYRIEVVGAVGVSGPTGPQADAEYLGFDNPIDTINDIDVGVLVDGSPVDWGPYSNDHVYSTDLIGDGAPLSFGFADTFAGDNVGSFTVLVYQIPEPATIWLGLTALATSIRRRM
ncbi:hypothetical protein Pla108_38210 [Botrimarina colliarenosi]|uniref:PEP-CTERM protein-sorting domain-containing protein n=1 Tax=Botrimarina colliarenosi TaxID=2528001 RepID=A0A5C6A3Q2_9BACT|nr:hypothetical protein [Botrimarina colliarenosi]TWT94109.1 hypothetical protein Pla108_38210 [Botrimarina colliarenosi]